MAAGLLDVGSHGAELGGGAERDVDAVGAVGVAPGAFVGVLGNARLAGLDRRVDDGFDLVGREQGAGVLRSLRVCGGDEDGCGDEQESGADHGGLPLRLDVGRGCKKAVQSFGNSEFTAASPERCLNARATGSTDHLLSCKLIEGGE